MMSKGGPSHHGSSSSLSLLPWKGKRKISLPWFRHSLSRQSSLSTSCSVTGGHGTGLLKPPLMRQTTLDSPRSLARRQLSLERSSTSSTVSILQAIIKTIFL